MKRGKKIFSSTVAALTLAFGVAAGSAFADDTPVTPDNQTPITTQVANDNASARQPENLTQAWHVSADPLVPVPALFALGVLTLALTGFALRRRMPGSALRAGASAVVLAALINPEFVQEEREPLPTEVAIVVDKSASQHLDGRDILTGSAYEKLVGDLSAIEGINIRTIEVDGTKDGQPVNGTILFEALNKGLVDVPRNRLGAVFVMTDGQVHDAPESATTIMNGAPLHVLLSGKDGEFDRRIVIDEAPQFGLVGESQTLRFHIEDAGPVPHAGEQLEVTVTLDGQQLQTQHAAPGEIVEMKLDLPHTGSNVLELKVGPVDGELTDVNNRVVTSVEGVREGLNVLLVSGQPTPGTRMWRELLKSDPDNNLIHFTIMYPPEKQDATPLKELATMPFPTREVFNEKLGEFDLVIFDSYEYRGLLPAAYLQYVNQYVKDGGAVMVVAGPEYAGNGSLSHTPLAEILPESPTGNVSETGYKPAVTEQGQRHPVTRNLPGDGEWGRWFNIVDATSREGNVLMEGAGHKPLLILDREAKGRVAMLMSNQAWLWARGYEGGGPHVELLRRVSHWLMKNPDLEEEALHLRRQGDQLIVEQQTMGDTSAPVTVTTPSGKTITVTPEAAGPGLWQASIPADELGIYSAEQSGVNASITFTSVGPSSPKEFSETLSTPKILQPLADETGGHIARMRDDSNAIIVPDISPRKDGESMGGDDWMGVRMTESSILKGVDETPLINPWLAFATALGLFGMALAKEGEYSFFRKGGKSKPSQEPDSKGPQGPSL